MAMGRRGDASISLQWRNSEPCALHPRTTLPIGSEVPILSNNNLRERLVFSLINVNDSLKYGFKVLDLMESKSITEENIFNVIVGLDKLKLRLKNIKILQNVVNHIFIAFLALIFFRIAYFSYRANKEINPIN
ncbi:hypothetical protein BpHYR1_034242 [Brachionus plicatilis]|uniref:Uncharacterized protein n=1 Tax=Brachionus plicatilis TaxID=10195 RepID=A0A3M7RWP3_BRAPC|nr:hypothetical protein BpHYR1_034242 [Brachionus plicatilis]